MNKQLLISTLTIAMAFSYGGPVCAAEKKMAMPDHVSQTQDHSEMSDHGTKMVDNAGKMGYMIHETMVDGFHLAYHLLDLPGRDVDHLMVYVTNTAGKPVTEAKVGYMLQGPDGEQQKVMAMAMKDSFGGDINLTVKGTYTIKVKVMVGEQQLRDSFSHENK